MEKIEVSDYVFIYSVICHKSQQMYV